MDPETAETDEQIQGTPTPEPGGTPTPAESTPEQLTEEATTAAAAAPPAEEEPAPGEAPMPEWMKKRLAAITAARREAERRAEEAERQLKAAKGTSAESETGAPLTEEEVQRRAEALAAERVQAMTFNQACNDIAAKGREAYKDFDESLKNFDLLGGLQPSMVQMVMETDAPSEVLHALSKNLEKAAEIFSLPPVKQVRELLKFEASLKKAPAGKAVSSAPAPIEPKLGGGSRATSDVDLYDDKTDTRAWIEARNKQLAQRTVH